MEANNKNSIVNNGVSITKNNKNCLSHHENGVGGISDSVLEKNNGVSEINHKTQSTNDTPNAKSQKPVFVMELDEIHSCTPFEVTFGDYNGPLVWYVIAEAEGKQLLLSKRIVRYSKIKGNLWPGSDVRKWLNGSFLDEAFSFMQKLKIVTTQLPKDESPEFKYKSNDVSKDKVFILSADEISTLVHDRNVLLPDGLSDWNSVEEAFRNSKYWYWLRTPGALNGYFAVMAPDASIVYYGADAEKPLGLRPAIWVNK